MLAKLLSPGSPSKLGGASASYYRRFQAQVDEHSMRMIEKVVLTWKIPSLFCSMEGDLNGPVGEPKMDFGLAIVGSMV